MTASWRRVGACAGLVFGLQAFVLYRAFHGGVLSALIPWDDCLVLHRALVNLQIFAAARSLAELVGTLRDVVIHSPVSDLPVMLGLMLGGGAVAAPYVLNGLPVLLALWVVLVRAARPDFALSAALALCLLWQPMTAAALTFLKADWKAGVLMAAAVVAFYEGAVRADHGLRIWGAVLLGVATAAKLTAVYMPVLALLMVVGFEALAFALDRSGPADVPGERRRILVLAAALVLGPYVAFYLLGVLGHHGLLGYIAQALGETWDDGRTTLGRAAYYSPFGASPAWGRLPWQLAAFVAAGVALSLHRRDRRFLLFVALMAAFGLIALAPLAIARTSNPEFGAVLTGFALGATLVSISVVARSLPRWATWACLAVTAALSLEAPFDPPLYPPEAAPRLAELRRLDAAYRDVVAEIDRASPDRPPRIAVLYEHLYAPFPNLALLYFERSRTLPSVWRVDELPPRAGVAGADFVLTLAPTGSVPIRGLERRFATSADPAAADRFVSARSDFVLVRAYPVPGGELHLHRARPASLGLRPALPWS